MKTNTPTSWGSVARGLHWLVALLIVIQLPLGWIAHEMENSPAKVVWMTTHKSLGITLMLLMLLRLLWRLSQTTPVPPAGIGAWQNALAKGVHWALYAVVLAQTAAGWLIADTSRIPWKLWWFVPLPDWLGPAESLHRAAEELHEFGAWTLVALLAVHVAAALWHHFVRRDEILRRIWSG